MGSVWEVTLPSASYTLTVESPASGPPGWALGSVMASRSLASWGLPVEPAP